jgi:stress response protein YsnF
MQRQVLTAMFDNYDVAAEAVRRLKSAGIDEADISLVGGHQDELQRSSSANSTDRTDETASGAGTGAAVGATLGGGAGLLAGLGMLAIPGIGPVVAAGWLASTLLGTVAGAATGAVTGGLIGALTDAGVPEEDAHAYSEGIRRGGTLVTARVEPSQVDRAIDILDDEGSVNMDERVGSWRKEGWNGRFGEPSEQARTEPGMQQQGSVPIVEENLKVGKRAASGGRVRVHSHVVEQPVEQQVNLRDERVRVERQPVDRPVGSTDGMIQDRVIEAQETVEEPVVAKEARVKEVVRVSKEPVEHTETVRDKVRRTEVEIDDRRQDQTGGRTKKA